MLLTSGWNVPNFSELLLWIEPLVFKTVCSLISEKNRDFTGLLGVGLRVLNIMDSEVLMNKLTMMVKLQQPLQSSLLTLGNNHWKLSKILPEEQNHEVIFNGLGTASENISLALGCTQHKCRCSQWLLQLPGKGEKEHSLLKFVKLFGIMPLIWRESFSLGGV